MIDKDLIQILAKQLVRKYPNLSEPEAEVIAFAYRTKDYPLRFPFPELLTCSNGYFDCRNNFEGPSWVAPMNLRDICERLNGEYLQEHPTQHGMYKITEKMWSVCDELAKRV